MDYTVFKTKILTKSSIEVANASLFEILYNPLPGWPYSSIDETFLVIFSSTIRQRIRDNTILGHIKGVINPLKEYLNLNEREIIGTENRADRPDELADQPGRNHPSAHPDKEHISGGLWHLGPGKCYRGTDFYFNSAGSAPIYGPLHGCCQGTR